MEHKKEISFMDIIQLIADGKAQHGQKFYTISDGGTEYLTAEYRTSQNGRNALLWKDTGTRVQLEPNVINDMWYTDEPDTSISFLEAMRKLSEGYRIKIVDDDGHSITFDYWDDIRQLWIDLEVSDFEDLTQCKFYLVED